MSHNNELHVIMTNLSTTQVEEIRAEIERRTMERGSHPVIKEAESNWPTPNLRLLVVTHADSSVEALELIRLEYERAAGEFGITVEFRNRRVFSLQPRAS